ncbi:hypothetical protein GY45DRAFT_335378 [Cubamyces sp. BRFM 1775]|nr:hypothetical protein GY45DRAFT_335378 [Cubamyces sp. BRFM 1775]
MPVMTKELQHQDTRSNAESEALDAAALTALSKMHIGGSGCPGGSESWLHSFVVFCQQNKMLKAIAWNSEMLGPKYAPIHIVTVTINGVIYGRGESISTREAREVAAELALRKLLAQRAHEQQ